MQLFRRRSASSSSGASDIATKGVTDGGWATSVVSAIALAFSAYSLWETSLRQAELDVYVTGVVTYERDTSDNASIQPLGGFEVLAVPVTIANGGARDGAVLSLQLDARNPTTGLTARFEATYTADAVYFAAAGTKRPKTPFSALVIAGRSAWTGAILFYPVSYSNEKALTPVAKVAHFSNELRTKYASEMGGSSSMKVLREKLPNLPELAELDAYGEKVLNQNDKVEVTLTLVRAAPSGWLDRALEVPVPPITLTVDMPDIPGDHVSRGELVRLRTTAVRL